MVLLKLVRRLLLLLLLLCPVGPGWPLFDPVAAPALAALMASHALHIMPSEREGFGHTINEGRAVGALLVVPDHPPMNELVRDGSGVLISPDRAFSHEDNPVPALGAYGNISVSLSAQVNGSVQCTTGQGPADPGRRRSRS